MMSAAAQDALAGWLAHLRGVQGRAPLTLDAYAGDVRRWLDFLARHRGGAEGVAGLSTVPQADLRAFLAAERARGVGARSLARRLSAVKGFAAWLADRQGHDATPTLAARAPRYRRNLPRPLAEDAARGVLADIGGDAAEPWIAARDTAVATLLYALGLRISEALALRGASHPLPETLRITGKGGKTRVVPVLPVAREAVARYVQLCPFDLPADGPLFRGARGGPLAARLVQAAMERSRHRLGLPASATPHALRHSFTTQAYTAVDEARLMDVYLRAHPRA
jgi:integrase/recombinase XerC